MFALVHRGQSGTTLVLPPPYVSTSGKDWIIWLAGHNSWGRVYQWWADDCDQKAGQRHHFLISFTLLFPLSFLDSKLKAYLAKHPLKGKPLHFLSLSWLKRQPPFRFERDEYEAQLGFHWKPLVCTSPPAYLRSCVSAVGVPYLLPAGLFLLRSSLGR